MDKTLTSGRKIWWPKTGAAVEIEGVVGQLRTGAGQRKEAAVTRGLIDRIVIAPNLLFLALIFLQLLPSKRPDESAIWFLGLTILLESCFLMYSFLRQDGEKVETLGDLTAVLYGALFLWEFLTVRLNLLDKMLFPSPSHVLALMVKEIPAFITGLVSSLGILVVGYGAGAALGAGLGLIVGYKARLRRLATPLTRVLGPIPPTVYIPYAIVLLPTFKLSSMFVIFVGSFWPVFINAMNGVLGIEGRIIDSAKVLNLDQKTMLLRIILPGALPSIMTGATIGLAMSFILLTAAEMIGATAGLGWYIKYFSDFADYPRVIVGIIFAGIVVTGIMYVFDRFEKRLLRWRR